MDEKKKLSNLVVGISNMSAAEDVEDDSGDYDNKVQFPDIKGYF